MGGGLVPPASAQEQMSHMEGGAAAPGQQHPSGAEHGAFFNHADAATVAALTERIMRGVAERMYEEPHSGRRLPGLLRAAGLADVRLLTHVYQDTTLEPWTKTFLEGRAERAIRFGLVGTPTSERWLDGFTEVVAAGAFVLTVNYYGAVGVKAR